MTTEKKEDILLQKIYALRGIYFRHHRIRPNVVYMGRNQFYTFVSSKSMASHYLEGCKWTLFGMIVYTVIYDNHLSVGYVMEDSLDDKQI
jgi:hypothetical protein